MKKPIIAVDIDDVLSHNVPAFLEWSNQQYGTSLTLEDYDEDWAKMWQVDHAEAERRNHVWHAAELFAGYEHREDALPVLQHLKQRFDLAIITSRPTRMREITLEWLDSRYPDLFIDVHFAGMWDTVTADSHKATKADLAQKLGISYLIDDQPKHVLAVAELGIPAVLFGSYPWNQDVAVPDGVIRCADWKAVQEYFDGQA